MKTIGMIGGSSWVSTIEYYRAVNEMINQRRGGNHFARCILYSVDFNDIAEINRDQDWERLRTYLISIARTVETAGAGCLIICANTPHIVADDVAKSISIPLIHIGDVTVNAIRQQGLNTVALLGTKFTMEKDFIKGKFARLGITVLVPNESDREFIHRSILTELGNGVFTPETKRRYCEIIETLAQQGAQGVILGCTEIPLLVKPEDVSIPTFDTTLLHAAAAVEFALEP
jgi:aspartate racemase